jgi:hypothetical protein
MGSNDETGQRPRVMNIVGTKPLMAAIPPSNLHPTRRVLTRPRPVPEVGHQHLTATNQCLRQPHHLRVHPVLHLDPVPRPGCLGPVAAVRRR